MHNRSNEGEGPSGSMVATTSSILTNLTGSLKKHVVLTPEQRLAVAAWIMHTYVYDLFNHSPLLLITAPRKRCGKSVLATLVALLSKGGQIYSRVTEAGLQSLLDEQQGTVVLDECDTYLLESKRFQSMLNGGYHKFAAKNVQMIPKKKEGWKKKTLSSWGPKAITMIGQPAATITDRSIQIEMVRKDVTEEVEPVSSETEREAEVIRRDSEAWATLVAHSLPETRIKRTPGFNDRAWEIWLPLLTIVELAGPKLSKHARKAARRISALNDDDDAAPSPAIDIIGFLYELLRQRDCAVLRTSVILDAINDADYLSVGRVATGQALTPKMLANILAPYRLRADRISEDGTNYSAYFCEDVKRVAERLRLADSAA